MKLRHACVGITWWRKLRNTETVTLVPASSTSAPSVDVHSVVLSGHLTAHTLDAALDSATKRLQKTSGKLHLLFDCLTMTGYERAARDRFVEWHRGGSSHIGHVAILTRNPLWHVVVSAMSLASGRKMKAFASQAEAMNWLLRQN
ncbi:MAG: STAS/SEC14 domain-containing protein [Polyangiaceae bacterium]